MRINTDKLNHINLVKNPLITLILRIKIRVEQKYLTLICYILQRVIELMKKSYWLKKVSIANTDIFLEYIRTVLPWLKSVGGIVIKKDISQESDSSKWDGGNLGMIIEFDSQVAAKKAFYSDVFQNYLISRDLTDLVTISTL